MFESGLYLENTKALIPWGITATDAASIGSPRVVTDDSRSDIIWGPESIFDGLDATIHAVLYGGQKLKHLDLNPLWSEEPYKFDLHYTATRDHLTRALGEADVISDTPYASQPSYAWIGERGLRLSLWVFDRFGEQLKLSVGCERK